MTSIQEIQPSIRVAHHYRFPVERNSHETGRIGYCYAFHLIDGGKGKVTVPGHAFVVKKGDLIFFPPKLMHSFYSDPDHLMSMYNIYCEFWTDLPVTGQHLVWDASAFNPRQLTIVKPDPEINGLPYFLPLQHHGTLMELFAHIVAQQGRNGPYTAPIVNSLLKAFILELLQIAHNTQPVDYRIKIIMDRIDKEANVGSDYKGWLEQSGLQKTQFHELFKQAAGMSPKAYWTKAIMKQAEVILWESRQTVTDIAEYLGYSSIHHFTKQFKSYYGVSPSEFRKRRY